MSLDEKFRSFLTKIELARSSGEEWVETTQEVIDHFNPQGLSQVKPTKAHHNPQRNVQYFIFKGIKVCLEGKSTQLSQEINEPSYKRLGMNEGTVEGTHD